MTTDQDYESVARRAYNVDPLWQNPTAKIGDKFYAGEDSTKQEWVVIDVAANAKNGFQGMAVVPAVGGVPDYSNICIAYAGTNPSDPRDVLSDAWVVGNAKAGKGTQAGDAMTFAEKVEGAHPGATVTTAGHSLGGFLALYVAAEKRWSSTTFNAPDPWRVLSAAAKDWATQNSGAEKSIKNYVNKFDTVGNGMGNRTGAGVFVEDVPGRPALDYHNIGKDKKGKPFSFRFDSTGGIIGAGADKVDTGVIAFNLGLGGAAELTWAASSGSPYPKVLVATALALALADAIRALTHPLLAIKTANSSLEDRMQERLDSTKRLFGSAQLSITEYDIENCVATNRLHAHENIDYNAVAAVNKRVDDHLEIVEALYHGIHNAVTNTLIHDAQAASTLSGR